MEKRARRTTISMNADTARLLRAVAAGRHQSIDEAISALVEPYKPSIRKFEEDLQRLDQDKNGAS